MARYHICCLSLDLRIAGRPFRRHDAASRCAGSSDVATARRASSSPRPLHQCLVPAQPAAPLQPFLRLAPSPAARLAAASGRRLLRLDGSPHHDDHVHAAERVPCLSALGNGCHIGSHSGPSHGHVRELVVLVVPYGGLVDRWRILRRPLPTNQQHRLGLGMHRVHGVCGASRFDLPVAVALRRGSSSRVPAASPLATIYSLVDCPGLTCSLLVRKGRDRLRHRYDEQLARDEPCWHGAGTRARIG